MIQFESYCVSGTFFTRGECTKTLAHITLFCVFFLFFIVECRHLPLQNNGNQQSHSHATYRNVQIKVRLLIIHRELSP